MLVKILSFVFLIPSILWSQNRRYEVPAEQHSQIISGMIAVKLHATTNFNTRIDQPFDLQSIIGIQEIESLRKESSNARATSSILDGMYWVRIASDIDPVEMCNRLLQYPEVAYAEVLMQEHLFAVPNDPLAQPGGTQGYLQVIKAYDAWDVTTGSTDIKIAIIDTGMDFTHEDLTAKYYVNEGESPEPNGVDDDGNGYVDDYRGYDFADNDPNAQADGSQHGTHVGGVVGAATNNGLGIAGVGYNTPISALKGFTTVGTQGTGLWPAVLYAAENGFDIANLSWGGASNYSQFLQDLITYCVVEKDMVLVAAAGNTNADLDFYPASYEHVLSVAGTTLTDTKWNSSTYSHHVDITAPAQSILSTQNNNAYRTDSGTSHAAPQVAGAAALVKSVFPEYNARQIMEQVRVTSDDIYSVGSNANFAYKLGKGRLNVYQAVTESNSRSLRVQNVNYNNGFGKYAFYGDTLSLHFDLTNYLAELNAPAIQVISSSPYVSFSGTSILPGNFQTMETKSISNLQVILAENTPPTTEIDLLFLIEDGSYTDFQNVTFRTNPNHVDYASNNLTLKVAGDGSLCYLDAAYTNGFSMLYNDQSVLPRAGLLIATEADNVQNNVTNAFGTTKSRDDDFQSLKNMKLMPHAVLPHYGYSEFGSKNGDFRIEQSIIPSQSDSYVILSYRIINTSVSTLTNVHTGLFADFILANNTANRAVWDEDTQAIVMNDHAEGTFAALKLLDDTYHYAALNMQALNGNVRDIEDTFTNAQKYGWLTGSNKAEAGTTGDGNDVAALASKSFTGIAPGESVEVAFVLALADSYAELTSTLEAAGQSFTLFKNHPPIVETVYSCQGDDVEVNPSAGSLHAFYKDPRGATFLSTGTSFTLIEIEGDTAIYVRNLDGPYPSAIRKITIKSKSELFETEIVANPQQLVLDISSTVQFSSSNPLTTSAQWFINDELIETVLSPTILFSTPGLYEVRLIAENEHGCSAETVLNYEVIESIPTGVEAQKGSIYPNPALRGSLLHLSQKYQTIRLIALDGKKVFQARNSDRFYIPTHIEEGVYMLLLTSANSSQSLKLLIQ